MADASPSLIGKTALVTGASRGIGRAIAQRLASAGARVIVAARTLGQNSGSTQQSLAGTLNGTLQETVELIAQAGGQATAIAADLESAADRAQLIEDAVTLAGGVDILVNNAGITQFAPAQTMPVAVFDRTIEHYLRIPFLLSQAVVPLMKERGAGWIVNIGSVAAMRPLPGHNLVLGDTVYAACKAALARMTQGLAVELRDDNIAVNLAAPSTAIRTPGGKDIIPEDFPTEDPAYLAETVLALSHLPASERSGLLAYSMHFPYETGLTVRTLDGRGELPRCAPPEWSHPDTAFHARTA